MSYGGLPRDYQMPTVDPDKEDENPEGVKIIKYTGPPPKVLTTKETVKTVGICPVVEKAEKTCDHVWKDYLGLSEQFTYCEICDQRK